MEHTIRQLPTEAGRPTTVPPLLLLSVAVGMLGMGLLMLASQSRLGAALILLFLHALRLVPPVFWVGAFLFVILWLIVLRREWRSS